MGALNGVQPDSPVISTPDQRLRVFVSSNLSELGEEQAAVKSAITAMRLTPVTFEPGVSPHPQAEVYRRYVEQSDVFVGIYWESYGWSAPGAEISSIEDELDLAAGRPRLVYVKEPAPGREPALRKMLDRVQYQSSAIVRTFSGTEELAALVVDDLAVLVTERFHTYDDESHLASGALTFFFADLEGSTGMLQRLGDGYQRVLGTYHRIVNDSVRLHHGHVVITEGDGFFCVFSGPREAMEAAHDIQVAMSEGPWPRNERPRCRIGIHTGTAARTMEGYVGLDVHVAARIGDAAQGGQIIVSAATADLVAEDAAGRGWTIVDLGQYDLRGVGHSERLHRIDMPGLDAVRTAPRARPKIPSTVPGTPKRLIGRRDDLRGAIEMIMRDMVRLVTLTGPGGTGKTRLAIEIARSLEERFPDGVVYVDLSAVRDPERFMPVVGRALGVRESADRTIAAALASVIGDGRMLVVIDNVEQLLPAVSSQVAELIEAMPGVKFLVTSRSPLRIAWEHEYPVPPLEVPEPGDEDETVDGAPAVTLFVERAKAARPLFEMNEVTRPVVVDVVRRLDGLPLAIELAAARLRMFSVEELEQRLDDRLNILDRGSADSPERHRTLRAAIGWSYDLLSDDERLLFRRLAVFSGGWTLAGAVAVCCDDEFSEPRVLDSMEELVAKSLVVFTINEEGRPRYRLLETLREFAVEQLRASGEEEQIRLRHLDWLQGVAERVLIVLPTPEFPSFLDDVERERFNIREGLAWAVRHKMGTEQALRVCGMLPLFWDTRGFVAEGLRWTRALVAMTTSQGNTEARGMAHTAMGWLEMLAGEADESEWALATAERMFREMGNDNWLGRTLSMRGMTTYNRGLLDEAEEQFNEAIVLCRESGLDWLADAWCTYGLAHVAMSRGDFGAAEPLLLHCFEYSKVNGLSWGVGHTQLSLSVMAFMLGDLEQSVERMIESIKVRAELRDSRGLCDCIGMMALHASVRGDHDLAATLIGAAEVAREASGDHLVPWQQPLLEQAVASAKANLGDDYEVRFMEGRRLTMSESISLILDRFESSVERSAVSA
ncbi:MAG TPA: DUF4062 domain-containing protein [Acidimicrobiia bacterium]